jgi:hypothetical protein
MNQHAVNMKNALNDYKKATDTAKRQIEFITTTYGQEAGEAEREIQAKKLEKARAAAVDTINKAAGAGYKEAEAWGRLDGSKLTDDVKLLDNGLVDKAEFDRLKAKYSGNYTMLHALRKYGEKQNKAASDEIRANGGDGLAAALAEPFDLRDIPTAEDKPKRWEKAQAQALDLLDAMDGSGKYSNPHDWGAAFTLAAMPETMEHFGENL